MRPFVRRKRNRIWAEFSDFEARLLITLTSQVASLLNDRHSQDSADPDPLASVINAGAPGTEPEDPVLARLLPSAYRDDFEDAADFRRLTERSLAEKKMQNSKFLIDSLIAHGLDIDAEDGPAIEVELDEAGAMAWLSALNDIRLALAIRLGIETEEDMDSLAESEDEDVLALMDVYEWLGMTQETLVAAL